MSSMNLVCDNVRAYPAGDAQTQHPASVGNGQGLLHHGRGQRKKLVREVSLRIASWNIGTMTGRGRELADVLERRWINIACLQETKWKGQRAREIGAGYKFYYCGSDGKRNGVGVVLDKELKNKVTDVKRVNDRVIVVRLLMEDLVLNVVSVYAPQTGCDDRMKEKFWEDFDAVIMRIPECEEIYIGGDFNGHVGRMNDGYERVHGGRGHGVRNQDGETLLEAALAFDLAIANTFYQKREQHIITYRSGLHSTQIDYILLRRNRLKSAKDCKVIPSESLVSQHRLLLLDLTLKVQRFNKSPKPPARTKWYRLDDRELEAKFKKRVIGKMIEMGDMAEMGVNECWSEMAIWVRSVARDVFGETKGKRKIDKETWWWNEEVRTVLKEKKNAFKEWKRVKDGNDREKKIKRSEYQNSKKKAKKTVAIARAKVQDKLYDSLESPQGQKDLFRILREREMNARDINHMKCIKDEAGKILTDDEEIKGRWKRYFNKLMNEENEWRGVLENVRSNEGRVKEVSIEEVRMAVESMKNGKAVGPDGIPAEVWKFLKVDGCKWLTLFFNKLLQEEVIPEEWCNSSLVPIFKNKGDIQDCSNYRGIKLMSHSMKIWEKVIARRMREESEITQNQFGFMPGRGTMDAIFALRQLCEKYRLAQRDLHMVFIDLEKAYDRVPRKVLWWAMKEKGVPEKYVRIVKAMYDRASTHVRSEAGVTGKFNVAVGLHQGSALSPYLFLLVMDALTSDIQEEAPWCMLFADDVVLVGDNTLEVQSRLGKWQERLENVGLKISRTKTKHLFCDFSGLSSFTHIALDGVSLPVCSDFRYLGSLIQNDGNVDRDVQNRINAGWMKWRQVSGTACDPRMPLKAL
ncbi:unnamed protein product [Euphydryas editha]|uniref:Reverse transcriptase domain-containing protein n=1 Tax=Euphydryas editha TaxID=104508 RepID=A0AAU9UHS6_EUPED|nr:unnamed protein product [Euphydryas editha]